VRRCRFDLSMDIKGLDIDKYAIINLGDKYAKIVEVYDKDSKRVLRLESRHKNRDFLMVIETVWGMSDHVFRVISAVVTVDIFSICSAAPSIPMSHLNTLKKWHEEMYG
jgi:hypothetical protein